MSLDAYQQAAFDAVLDRHENVFITGAAGTGKSWTIRAIVAEARRRGLYVSICSSTGRSAVELGLDATTVHGFVALGDTGERAVSTYVQQLERPWSEPHRVRIAATQLLIIDEVSMLSASFLGLVEAVVAALRRRTSEPWGGIQVVYSGDFAQLRPVPSSRKRKDEEPARPQLAFHAARAWRDANVTMYNLGALHRQSTDVSYGAFLNRARFGRVTPEDYAMLRTRIVRSPRELRALEDIASFVFSRNAQADAFNAVRIARLPDDTAHVYNAKVDITVSPKAKRTPRVITEAAAKYIASSMRALRSIELRVGARVLLLKNLDVADGLANGCIGTVVGFDDETTCMPYVLFDKRPGQVLVRAFTWQLDGDVEYKAKYMQLPLMLAWGTTSHRTQGLTLGAIVVCMTRRECFDAGMAYVNGSRVQRKEDLYLTDLDERAIYADDEVCSFYDEAAATTQRAKSETTP
jgi:ATP-dependent DNA helicase PIF1